MIKDHISLHSSAILPGRSLPSLEHVSHLLRNDAAAASTAVCAYRAAPRRTSYPAARGASTLIGSSIRTTAWASRQLLIGLSGQVARVTSAPPRTAVAGRWGNSGQRHRRQLQQSPRVRHQADIERAGASAHGWMRDKRHLACPHGRNHRKAKYQMIPGNLWSRTEEWHSLFNHVGQNSAQGCVCASVETGTTLPLVAHPLGISAEDLLLSPPCSSVEAWSCVRSHGLHGECRRQGCRGEVQNDWQEPPRRRREGGQRGETAAPG